MPLQRFTAVGFFLFGMVGALSPQAHAAEPPISVNVDARDVTRGILHVHETVPGVQGEVRFVYPKWVPGEHAPNGPIVDLVSVVFTNGGERLAWRRDPIDLYSFYVTVPAGKSGVDVSFDYVNGGGGIYSSHRLSTPTMMVLTWHKVILTPFVEDYRTQMLVPSITLPGTNWQYATALDTESQAGSAVTFKPVSQEQLVDSPLVAGINVKKIALGSISGAPVNIAIFADAPYQLAIPEKRVGYLKNLVREMGALYGARHFNHYTFLLTVSDVMPGEGVEHHQSSDDGSTGNSLIDADAYADPDQLGDLLGHEFNHSWDGKYRRPYDLATLNLQAPMQDDLLWVYEGMTQFYGELQTERSGSWTKQQWLDSLASTYALLDATSGRDNRPLADTAVAASTLYGSPKAYRSMRRDVDYYPEGNLMWLEADVTIERLSGGKKSIDDFARAFFGHSDTGPVVLTYNRQDVIDALNAVQPYDWAGFFKARIDAIAPHPPDPFDAAGYRLVYRAQPNGLEKIRHDGGVDAFYSLGFYTDKENMLADVRDGSPAAKAGLAPGDKVIGVDGRTFGDDRMSGAQDPQAQVDSALTAAQSGGGVRLLVTSGNTYREVTIDYRGGPRFPVLERIANTPDLLSKIAAPKTSAEK
jgi:predicted metalloprotease with PDZ domain